MTTVREDRYVRLLRWYPKAWREAHGAVFLDTLREQSEHEGRARPSCSETFAAMVNGLGARLDARLAATLALAGIALATIVQTIVVSLASGGLADPVRNGLLSAFFGAVAMLVLVALLAVARTYGVLSPGRAVALITLGCAALALFSVGTYAWAFGFQLAEDNQAMTGVAASAMPLLAGALALGLVAGWLCMDGVLGRTRLRPLPRALLSVPTGGALAVFGGYSVFMQSWWVSVAVVVVALSLRSLGAWRGPRPTAPDEMTPRLVRPLAGVSAGIGSLGIVYAVTGAAWSPIATDGTVAVSQAILGLLIGAIPLTVALGLIADRGHRQLRVWGPVALAIAALATIVYGYTDSPLSTRIDAAAPVGSALLGLAIAWWVTARMGGSRHDRRVAGTAIILACFAIRAAALLPLAVFVMPLLAGILTFRGDLGRRSRTPNSTERPVPHA